MDTTFLPQPGRGGLPFVRLLCAYGASADVYLHGAHVTAWTPAGEAESRLFLSDRAVFADGKAIRGGVPVIFPQFSDTGPFVRHGFARTRAWTLVRATRDGAAALAVLALDDAAETRALWPHPFRLELTVRVEGAALELALAVRNPGPEPFAFTAALHTYLAADPLVAQLEGLKGGRYRDTADGGAEKTERAAGVAFDGGEIDRVYAAAPTALHLHTPPRVVDIEQEGFEDAVVWNPGTTNAAAMSDLAPGDAGRFVCVEAAQVIQPVALAAGDAWSGRQRLRAR